MQLLPNEGNSEYECIILISEYYCWGSTNKFGKISKPLNLSCRSDWFLITWMFISLIRCFINSPKSYFKIALLIISISVAWQSFYMHAWVNQILNKTYFYNIIQNNSDSWEEVPFQKITVSRLYINELQGQSIIQFLSGC